MLEAFLSNISVGPICMHACRSQERYLGYYRRLIYHVYSYGIFISSEYRNKVIALHILFDCNRKWVSQLCLDVYLKSKRCIIIQPACGSLQCYVVYCDGRRSSHLTVDFDVVVRKSSQVCAVVWVLGTQYSLEINRSVLWFVYEGDVILEWYAWSNMNCLIYNINNYEITK